MKKISIKFQATMLALLASSVTLPVFSGAQTAGFDGCAGNSEVFIGQDDDNVENALIQPVGTGPNQSLNNADILQGEGGCDVLIGLLGNDVLDGGDGNDITVGGTEQFDPDGFGNKDVMLGGNGNDINIWAPGDGSDAFMGGSGGRDAQIFGLIDRDVNNVPILTPVNGLFKETGVPTADVTGSPGFCRLEYVGDTNIGFDFLIRFFVRATGDLAVTIRLKDVEQVFCTSEYGGQITFADLKDDHPQFVEIDPYQITEINRTVAKIIR